MGRVVASGGTATVSAGPGDSIGPGESVFGPFGPAGRLLNDTGGAIVLDATDPSTATSLQAQGFTVPVLSADASSMTLAI